jgi:hypothetical protein
MPAGEAIELGTRKSSRFIGSECCSFELSTDFRSCAIPLGADVTADFFSSSFLHWQSISWIRGERDEEAIRRKRAGGLQLFPAYEVHCHHSPREVFQSLLVG